MVVRAGGEGGVIQRVEQRELIGFVAIDEISPRVQLFEPRKKTLALLGRVPVGQHLVDEGSHVRGRGAGQDPFRRNIDSGEGAPHGSTAMHVATQREQVCRVERVEALEPRGRHEPLDQLASFHRPSASR